jgi:RimJ/RimL family protein N-acetyltransferase
MGVVMIAERTSDKKAVEKIITLPEIFDCISEDDCDLPEIDVIKDCWLIIKVDDLCIGAYFLHPHNSTTLEIHAHILPEYRKEHAINSGSVILQWVLDECPETYQKIIAQVPKLYPNVKSFCEVNGFKVEGINRLSHRKNGVLHDQWLLGITRDEIKGVLNGIR